ncbi:hypothetical protein BXT89_00915 [Halopseudomonas pachastrellae]|uniref:diguanylate cyclase n=1 Tax=Halopseudomonas pachastrellae TaxID=254161 RepID=A0A1S8DLT6_9GAMM|nr:sensor domain-containing diguanylate cyclase [Halopseudomonas pachastrellae]ONM45889.1 hypothetical protein BXT89_00915 [Halopseudomonas pachastrellae]SFL96789.1 diguanylate cyclase (GGDEF) domain-containing protein [Halopseudomonas pachastrellae]
MIEAAIPVDESQRLAALRSMQLLDTPPDPHIDALLRIAQRLFGVSSTLVTLIDTDRQWFKGRIGATDLEGPRDVSFCGHTILSEDILYVQDAHSDERFFDNPAVTGYPFVRFYAGIALHAPNGSRIGSFCVHDTMPRGLTDAERDALGDFRQLFEALFVAHQLRMDAAWLQEALGAAERRALIDPLTQLWNRQGLRTMLPALVSRAEREELKVGFIYGDLDHFKRINDEHGHAGGDQVLIQSGQRMVAAIRPHDLAIRLGGEELAVLALVADEQELGLMAERLRLAFCRQPFELEAGALDVTISLGIAVAEPSEVGDDGHTLLERADAGLYQAKREGRNRVVRG